MIKVSIIVPVYNVEKYLRKCLDSLVNQTLKDIEIIVINDGSPDNSQLIIDEYQRNYPNLIRGYIKENGGQASARNYGIKVANGQYIMFVDSDDWIDKSMSEKLYNKAIFDKSDIVVCGAYKAVNDEFIKLDTFHEFSNDIVRNYILNCSGPCWQLIRKDIFINNDLKFLEHHFYEDIAIIPSLCLVADKISYLDECLYYYLIRMGSTMNQQVYSNSLEDIFDSLSCLTDLFIKNDAYQKYYLELEYLYIEHLLHAASLRFFAFRKNEQLLNIINIMRDQFPDWKNNVYYKKQGLKYKIVCNLFFKKQYKLLKILLKG